MNPLDGKEKEEPPAQSGGDTSSSGSSSKTPSLAKLQKIAASFGKEQVPEFIRTQIESLSKGETQVSELESPMEEDKPEPAPPDQETEEPPAQSGGDMSSSASSSKTRHSLRLLSRRLLHLPKRQKHQNLSESGHPKPDPSESSSDSEDGIYFEVLVTNSNCLPIYFNEAGDYFPSGATSSNVEQTLQLTDPLNHQHYITFIWFNYEDAFILTRNWPQYAQQFNIRLMDRVRFTWPKLTIQKPTPLNPRPRRLLHFLTQHFPRPEGEPLQINLSVFLPNKFLFQHELSSLDARLGRLAISQEQVRSHFRDLVWIARGKYEMVKFTDCNEKHWFFKIVYSDSGQQFMVIDGWEKLAREHELAPGDSVRFYGLDTHEMHFLIQFVKGKGGAE